ncbi:MAG: flagellar biosynthesis protein FlgJ [Pseudomonadota bacterium]
MLRLDTQGSGSNLVAPSSNPLFKAAQQLEATFISEMLKSAGFGEPRESFGGGAGEAQFSSFLRDLHAEAVMEGGGFGLAESIFNALKERSNGAD